MVQFNRADREIRFKIVYYGCALSGKTTNLEALHEFTDPEGKKELVSLKTTEDRTLFFDFLPFDIGEIQGYQIRLQVYTVPGQVHYNTTRKVVLAGTDSIIFVADSQPNRAQDNFVSWENMKANLLANRIDINHVPIVVQCNKRDLPDAIEPPEILAAMKVSGKEPILACALTGEGVVRTFVECAKATLADFVKKYKLSKKGVTTSEIGDAIEKLFEPYMEARREIPPKKKKKTQPSKPPLVMKEVDQLIAALESTTKLAEQYQDASDLSLRYQQRLKEMTLLNSIGRELASVVDASEALRIAAARLSEGNPDWTITVFEQDSEGPRPTATFGRDEDPLWEVNAPGAGNLALGLIQDNERKLWSDVQKRLEELKAAPIPEVGQALAIPLGAMEKPAGYFIVYTEPKKIFSKEKDAFLSLFEELITPRLQAIRLLRDVVDTNERLELKVTERTADLQAALEELKELDTLKRAFLNNVSHEMKTPLTNIRSYADLLRRYSDRRAENADEYLSIIYDESVHLEGLIDDLLSFTKVKNPPMGESCDLVTVLDQVREVLAPMIEEKALHLQVQKDEETIFQKINREDAEVLFKQLIDNAVKFSPEGVKIKVYLLRDKRKVIFAVRDYGPGFPGDQRDRLLEPVVEGESEVPSYKTPGLGMGLFLVREVLRKYHGGIAIEDMEPGSNVLVELPRDVS